MILMDSLFSNRTTLSESSSFRGRNGRFLLHNSKKLRVEGKKKLSSVVHKFIKVRVFITIFIFAKNTQHQKR